jgi:hypothetical protein
MIVLTGFGTVRWGGEGAPQNVSSCNASQCVDRSAACVQGGGNH